MIDYSFVPKFIYEDVVKRGYRVACGGGGCENYQTCAHPGCVKSFDMETGEVIPGDDLKYVHEDYLHDLHVAIRDARKKSDAAVITEFWGGVR